MFNNFYFFCNLLPFMGNCGKILYSWTTDDNMAHVHCMLHT